MTTKGHKTTTKKQNYKDRKWQQRDAKQPKEGQKLKNKKQNSLM